MDLGDLIHAASFVKILIRQRSLVFFLFAIYLSVINVMRNNIIISLVLGEKKCALD